MGTSEIIALIQALAIVVGGGWSIYLLWRSSRDRKAEWLWKLYTEFRQEPSFASISSELERGVWPGSSAHLDGYLGFLETVAVLCRMHQFGRKHSHAVFGYWVEQLGRSDIALQWLEDYGYEHLRAWAENRPYSAKVLKRK